MRATALLAHETVRTTSAAMALKVKPPIAMAAVDRLFGTASRLQPIGHRLCSGTLNFRYVAVVCILAARQGLHALNKVGRGPTCRVSCVARQRLRGAGRGRPRQPGVTGQSWARHAARGRHATRLQVPLLSFITSLGAMDSKAPEPRSRNRQLRGRSLSSSKLSARTSTSSTSFRMRKSVTT